MAHAYYGLWIRVSLILVLLRADCALAATNRTIDDADPQVTYSPNNQWSQGSTCSECLIKLDPSQTLDGTWHDTSHHTSDPAPRFMQVQFTGTAVYVFNVLANAVPGAATTTSLQFTLDGAEDGTFLHTPSDSPDPEFGVLVYARDGLDNVQHTLKMQAADTPDSVILFDFIAYTVPDESGPIDTTPPPSTITTITSTSLDLITTLPLPTQPPLLRAHSLRAPLPIPGRLGHLPPRQRLFVSCVFNYACAFPVHESLFLFLFLSFSPLYRLQASPLHCQSDHRLLRYRALVRAPQRSPLAS
ncbi:hypothetical protein C8T65DRAFT_231896 [Cerioporus squamosus]|nr:hypothetical protein C8T65DRAFT_231896 [Cerioporus squamosus]